MSSSHRYGSRAEANSVDGFGLFSKGLAIGFWGMLVTLIVGAVTAPGFAVFALLPLAGMPYLLFCLIAWNGDRNVE
jgi:hypothetical protein